MITPYESYLVSNANIDKATLVQKFPDLPPQLKEHKGSFSAVVLQVVMGNKKFMCCMAGGKLHSSDKSTGIREVKPDDKMSLAPLGKITLEVAEQFVTEKSNLIFRELKCNTSKENLQRKIIEAFSFAKEGDLLVLVGDLAGSCDGKILPLLNVRLEPIELPKHT